MLLASFTSFAKEDSLFESMMPKKYKKRSEAVVNIALVYYGDYYSERDLDRVNDLLIKRFSASTGNVLKVNTFAKLLIPFRHQIQNYPAYTQPHVSDLERLQRLWYYDNVGAKILKEAYEEVKKSPDADILKKVDALVIVTGAQFDALGFASGRVAVTENPMEVAWGLEGGGWVEFVSDERVVDELIHEIGHTLFLDHTSNQCQKPGMTYQEKLKCCEESPSKNDVMSYCRDRNKVQGDFFYGFEECNKRIIKDKVVPALLNGGEWRLLNREQCR